MSSIIFHAQRLHQGVYCSRIFHDPEHDEWRTQDAVANGAVLLAVVVDALGAILRMIVETLMCLRDLEEESDDIVGGSSRKHVSPLLDLFQCREAYSASDPSQQCIL